MIYCLGSWENKVIRKTIIKKRRKRKHKQALICRCGSQHQISPEGITSYVFSRDKIDHDTSNEFWAETRSLLASELSVVLWPSASNYITAVVPELYRSERQTLGNVWLQPTSLILALQAAVSGQWCGAVITLCLRTVALHGACCTENNSEWYQIKIASSCDWHNVCVD